MSLNCCSCRTSIPMKRKGNHNSNSRFRRNGCWSFKGSTYAGFFPLKMFLGLLPFKRLQKGSTHYTKLVVCLFFFSFFLSFCFFLSLSPTHSSSMSDERQSNSWFHLSLFCQSWQCDPKRQVSAMLYTCSILVHLVCAFLFLGFTCFSSSHSWSCLPFCICALQYIY